MLLYLQCKKLGLNCVVSSKDSKYYKAYIRSNCRALYCITSVSIAECKLSIVILATRLSVVRARC
jgi:hypothetical protein